MKIKHAAMIVLAGLSAGCGSRSSENDDLTRENKSLKKEVERLRSSKTPENLTDGSATTGSADLLTRNEALATQISEQQAEIDRLRQANGAENETNANLRTEVSALNETMSSMSSFYNIALKPYEGVWVAELDDNAPSLRQGCQLFLRVDINPIAYHRIVACENGETHTERFALRALDSRYHAPTTSNAMRHRLVRSATSCTRANPNDTEADLYIINFTDTFGENARPQFSSFMVGNKERYYKQGHLIPELLRNARCPEILQRSESGDATPLLKLAASVCKATLETSGCISPQ